MNWDVTEARVQSDNQVWVRFRDGQEGVVQFLPSAFRGVFEHLREPSAFRQAQVVGGVLTWPGELDLAPDAMHEAIASGGIWVLD